MRRRAARAVPFLLITLVAGCATRAAAPVAAAPPPAPATIANVRYELGFDSTTARARNVRVAMAFDVRGDGPVHLSLPAWTPGAYEIANFARWVGDFSASSGGAPLRWDKADHDTWRVFAGDGQPVTVAFSVTADTLDNAMAWSAEDFLMVNGTAVFLFPEHQPAAFPSRVTVRTQAGWRVATGMTPSGTPHEYTAASYHELVDMPFFIGHFDVDSAGLAEGWMRLASYPADGVPPAVRERILADAVRMVPPQQAVFGVPAFRDFTILQVADPAHAGLSALEHANSFVVVTMPEAIGTTAYRSIVAHELFHAWNVKRLRPAALTPYRYDGPQPTEWLWVSEGITDYYADLTLVRSGLVDSAGFFAATVAKIVEVDTLPPLSLEDASLSTWLRPPDGTHYAYYTKGSLAGLMLDIMIRDASDNRGSLDMVMASLHDVAAREGRGFTADDWWRAVSSAAGGRTFAEVEQRFIDGRDPYPWDVLLPKAAMRLVADTVREPVVGILVRQDTSGLVVAEVEQRSAAALAGIREGDQLLSLGGIPVDARDFAERLRAAYGRGEEPALPVGVRRAGRRITIVVPVTYLPVIEYSVIADSGADAPAVRIRNGILRGTTDK